MTSDLLLIAAGLVALVAGGEALVRGAVAIARRAGLSPMVIGLTLVGFGTSTPELLTSLQAAFAGAPGIALGNVVGSNIANVLLILGVAAMIAPVAVDPRALRRDGLALALATALAVGLVVAAPVLGRVAGALLLAGLVLFLTATLRRPPDVPEAADFVPDAVPVRVGVAVLQFAGGLAVTLLGARLLVQGAVGLAEAAGLSPTVIGLTIVAVGTSLPELVTSAVAARRGASEVALGNVIGSNIFNLLGILGATALVHPLAIPARIAAADIWIMATATAALIVVAATGARVSRREGAGLLAAFAAYTAWLLLFG